MVAGGIGLLLPRPRAIPDMAQARNQATDPTSVYGTQVATPDSKGKSTGCRDPFSPTLTWNKTGDSLREDPARFVKFCVNLDAVVPPSFGRGMIYSLGRVRPDTSDTSGCIGLRKHRVAVGPFKRGTALFCYNSYVGWKSFGLTESIDRRSYTPSMRPLKGS